MCTTKQIELLTTLAKEREVEIDISAYAEKSVEEVSKKISELTKLPRKEKQVIETKTKQADKKPSGVRLGLAAKLVIQEQGVKYAIDNKKETVFLIKELYELLAEADASALSSSRGEEQ